jgi:hypothetical protein
LSFAVTLYNVALNLEFLCLPPPPPPNAPIFLELKALSLLIDGGLNSRSNSSLFPRDLLFPPRRVGLALLKLALCLWEGEDSTGEVRRRKDMELLTVIKSLFVTGGRIGVVGGDSKLSSFSAR